MLTFYRPLDCPTCTALEETLKELVIAHRLVVVTPERPVEGLGVGIMPPALQDSGQTVTGHEAIAAHLQELETFVAAWRKFEGDTCYIDDKGEVC
ncbi:MAG TPA: glutathione S-transferase N-terminal domain-containing protein [Anaerolineae bacterium]